jgi:hypothetical protein
MGKFLKLRAQARIAVLLFAATAPSFATTLCSSLNNSTLNNFVSAGTCSIGNLVFTFPSSGAYTGPGGSSSVLVQTVGTGDQGIATGFSFSYTGSSPANGWTVNSGNLTDLNLAFSGALGPLSGGFNPAASAIVLATLTISDTITNPDGSLNRTMAAETVSGAGKIQLNIASTSIATGNLSLSGASYSVSKDILVKDLNGGSNTINFVTETFTYVAIPEPASFVLMGAGLAIVWALRRRKGSVRVLGGLIVVLVLWSTPVRASPLCTSIGGENSHISDFIAAGSCSTGDVLFTFDSNTYVTSGNADFVDTAAQAAMYFDVDNGNLGFHFVPVTDASSFFYSENETVTISFSGMATTGTVVSFYSSYAGTIFGTTGSLAGSSELTVNGLPVTTTPPGNDPLANFIDTGSGSGIFEVPLAAGTVFTFTNTYYLDAPDSDILNDVHISDTVMQITETLPVVAPTSAPEPATVVLTGCSLMSIAGLLWRKSGGMNG